MGLKYCNFKPGQSNYKNLTCEKFSLSDIETLSKEKAIGNHRIIKISKCFKCGRHWKIFEEFDSHHGYNRVTIRVGENLNIWNTDYNFDFDELNTLD